MTVRSSEDVRAPSRYADHRSPLRYRSSALGVGGAVHGSLALSSGT
jgi:hypothetical protein